MLNEHASIRECLDGFAAQTYPEELLDVIVVDGGSTDGSRQVVEQRVSPWLRIIDNPEGTIPAGCNLGLAAARGSVTCFFSAHGIPSPTYVENLVRVLGDSGAVGAGGPYHHEGVGAASKAIGLAMTSPFGMASPHRFARQRQEVDTVSHAGYLTRAIREVGGFDQLLLANEDYELNYRLRMAGGRLIFDPSIVSTYRPRSSLRDLGRQFWRYGRWKAQVVKKHPRSMRLRHAAPPALVVASLAAPLLMARGPGRVVVGALGAGYCVAVIAATALAPAAEVGAQRATLLAAFPVMHVTWGAGFLAGLIRPSRRARSSLAQGPEQGQALTPGN